MSSDGTEKIREKRERDETNNTATASPLKKIDTNSSDSPLKKIDTNNSDPPLKKIDTNNSDSPLKKVVKVNSDSIDNQDICSICMDESQTLLPNHNCHQCKPSAWRVCELCDSNLLSRQCPYCQGDYKEKMYYGVKGLPKQFPFNFAQITDIQEKYIATLKTRLFCDIVLRENCLIWSPSECRMYFSLPRSISNENTTPTPSDNDMDFILSSIPMSIERMGDQSQFAFTNKIWDELEKETENSENESIIATPKEALKWILQHGVNETSVIMTPISPEAWDDLHNDMFSM
jgi:hypothetical protein